MGKFLVALLITAAIRGDVMASGAYTNFSGSWRGQCQINGQTKPSTKEITQLGDRSVTINGQTFDLTKPSVVTLDDEDQGKAYREITVYDFRWDPSRKFLDTSARWVGWYLNHPGSWSGSGTGVIKIENAQLVTTRSFGETEELCTYTDRG